MKFYIVTMTHPDGPGWGEHAAAHVEYLRALVSAGHLKASGPLKGEPTRAGFLIFAASDPTQVDEWVAADPFAVAELISTLEIHEWDPLFGTFSAESSGSLPGLGSI